jgi:hypothetical protein
MWQLRRSSIRLPLTKHPRAANLSSHVQIPAVPSSERGCRRLTTLPSWDDGRFHVVFDMRDRYWPVAPLLSEWAAEVPWGVGSAHARCDLGRAVSVKSSMSSTYTRPRFDVVLPLFQLRYTELPAAPPGVRSRLAVFAGTLGRLVIPTVYCVCVCVCVCMFLCVCVCMCVCVCVCTRW